MPNEEYDDIITLTSESNEEIDFVNIAQIVYQSKIYAILQPVELLDGMDGKYKYTALTDEYKQQIEYVKNEKLPAIVNSNGMDGFTYIYEASDDYFLVVVI